MPELPYAALVIENQGDQDILVRVFRPWTVGHINQELFSMVRIPAGETLVRGFPGPGKGRAPTCGTS